MNRLTTVMDSRHLTLEDLGNSLLTGWPIQRIFCSSTEEKHTQQKEVELNIIVSVVKNSPNQHLLWKMKLTQNMLFF